MGSSSVLEYPKLLPIGVDNSELVYEHGCWVKEWFYLELSYVSFLEKEVATHSSVLAWRIPGMAEPGGLPSMGSHRDGHDWSDLAAAAAACKLSVKHSMCIKVFSLVLPELELLPLCLCHFNYMWRKNSLGHWMRTFSNTPSTVSNLPLLLLLLLFSCSVVSHSLWHHGLKNYRLPCSSPFPGVCSKSCPLSRWCHPTISSSVVLSSSCLQSFPA